MADDKVKRAAAKGFLGIGALYEHAVNSAKENLAQGLNEFGIEDKMKVQLPAEQANPNQIESEYQKRKRLNAEGEAFRQRQQKGRYQGN